MHSESEVRWVRAKITASGVPIEITDWHVIIPGLGDINVPPGTACSTPLGDRLQFESHTAIKTMDGKRHAKCEKIARDWVKGIDPSPGPAPEPEPPVKFKAPDNTYTEMRRRRVDPS